MAEVKYTPFDLAKAKAGAKIMTRGGRPARILRYDLLNGKSEKQLAVAVVIDEVELVDSYPRNGLYHGKGIDRRDLVMCPEEKDSKTIVLTKEDATAISVAEGFIRGSSSFFIGERSETLARLAMSLSQIRDKYDRQFEEE